MLEYVDNIIKQIPNSIKDLNVWLCYDDRDKPSYQKYSDKEINKLKKQPRDLRGIPYGINNRCFTFDECIDSIRKGLNSGVGIVVNNDLLGLDFDNCIKEIKKIDNLGLEIPILKQEVQEIINKLDDSYVEISQSGKGLHCLVYSSLGISKVLKNDNIEIEIYSNKSHFMRLSGNVINNNMFDPIILDKTDVILDIYNKYFNIDSDKIVDKDIGDYDVSFRDSDYRKQFNGLSNGYDAEQILSNLFKRDKFYYKLYNNELTSDDIDKYNAKRKGRGLKDTSNSGLSVLLILNLMYYSYGSDEMVYNIFKSSKLYKKEYDKIVWRSKGLTKLDMIVNYCKSRFRNFKNEEYK